ncbi:MAG: 30S ribosomal protein S4 [Candidatus Electronema sp. V4]|uniref:30S ribosomal protein S4 n=1 Tax=Candidatus Electronema sp. V4 TaxID=3454756 RepID=UPI00405575E8
MARYIGASCRMCRRENLKLYLKGERCHTDKCSFERRAFAPGQHGQNQFRKSSNYAEQLREKQKVKRMYGMLEDQFRRYFHEADRAKGVTGHNLLAMLECRLDNVVHRLGFASSRDQARQLIRHNHFQVGGRKVNIPSFQVKAGDVVSLKEKSRKNAMIQENLEDASRRGITAWLELDKANFQGKVMRTPVRDEITMPINEHLIVELYSK